MGKRIFVGNLSFDTTSPEIEKLFAQHGTCESVSIVTDRATGRSRGFAFVDMSSASEAQQAINALNGTQVGGRNLTVNEARPKAARSGGGGGGFGGGGGRRSREPRW